MPTPPHYSPTVQLGNLVFTSGQLPLISRTPKQAPEGIEAQTLLCLQKVEKVIAKHGLTKKDILKTTAFIADIADWGAVNQVYADFFGDHKPARSIIPVKQLNFGCKIEIEAIAGKE
ncbi:MAG: RidA family protein [Bacteroidota bacterium]